MLIDSISVVMIAKDAASTIGISLESLKSFSEVIVYLNNSSDETEDIAKTYVNVKIIHGEFIGFGPTKNVAASYASNDWILSLDTDEVLDQRFVEYVQQLHLKEDTVYTILRSNYYKDKEIKHCWGNDVIVRLYHRNRTSFTNSKVHEKILDTTMKVESLKGEVKHFPYAGLSDFIMKIDRYSSLFADANVGKKSSSPAKAILNAKFSFIKTYFLKKGFLDGYAGLIIAFSHMATNFYKYMKLYEANKELKK